MTNLHIAGPFVTHFFTLDPSETQRLKSLTPQFGFDAYGKTVFYRTYSRQKEDGTNEDWADVIIRVVNGVISIRKNHYINNGLGWDDDEWQDVAYELADDMFHMRAIPPGRGLWACGTQFMYERGSAALNNCGAASTRDLILGVTWTMDMLMCGVGVGYDTLWDGIINHPDKVSTYTYVIPDTREGWVESVGLLLSAYIRHTEWSPDFMIPDGGRYPVFDYSEIRPAGALISGFGGKASGPEPLRKLHKRIEAYLDTYLLCRSYPDQINNNIIRMVLWLEENDASCGDSSQLIKKIVTQEGKTFSATRVIVDLMNSVGACVVAGNVRRSAMLSLGEVNDQEFMDLKNYGINPERECIGWMSNNSVRFCRSEDFARHIPKMAERIRDNGEPGFFNQINVKRFGRVGRRNYALEEWTREQEEDHADKPNPCITGDSLILTNEGLKSVTELVGRQFIAIVDGKEYPSTEHGFWSNGHKEIVKLELENGSSIKATTNHKFKSDGVWTKVKDLDVGHSLVIYNNSQFEVQHSSIIISYTSYINKTEEVYDCCIPGPHRFYANGILSHNCSEIPLESFELCNLSEIFPTRCVDEFGDFNEEVYKHACMTAAFYTSTVSLLPTHSSLTNRVIARNRRTGNSMSGLADYYCKYGFARMIDICRMGYKTIRAENTRLAREAGVMPSIRVTTNKPSGTVSGLVGVSPGIHFPTFRYAIRRMRIAANHNLVNVLKESGVPFEEDQYSDNTLVFEFPIDQGGTRPATDVNMWEQFQILTALQREWSDNMVSVTIYFDPETESDQIEAALAMNAPMIKSVSLLPHTETGAYAQMPYEGIAKEQYEERCQKLKDVDWKQYRGHDGEMPRYCTNDTCTL